MNDMRTIETSQVMSIIVMIVLEMRSYHEIQPIRSSNHHVISLHGNYPHPRDNTSHIHSTG